MTAQVNESRRLYSKEFKVDAVELWNEDYNTSRHS